MPRPPVEVASNPDGVEGLQVTVRVQGAGNALQSLRFGVATNALIDVSGQTGLTGNHSLGLAAGTQQTTFTIRRATAGRATTVPLTVVDGCGTWPTFLGGGPTAF
jgi:hypothetical protein